MSLRYLQAEQAVGFAKAMVAEAIFLYLYEMS